MRGDERYQDGMFSYVSLEQRVPEEHPLRAVRKLTDKVLESLSGELDKLYADSGRPSIAPEIWGAVCLKRRRESKIPIRGAFPSRINTAENRISNTLFDPAVAQSQ